MENDHVYLVNFLGGTCGNFISGLISNLAYDIDPINSFSKFGNAHGSLLKHNQRTSRNYNMNKDSIYNYAEPINPRLPLVMMDHVVPIWEELFLKYPNCKNIIITVTPKDSPRIQLNMWFKVISEFSHAEWLSKKEKQPQLFEGINSPEDITPAITEKLFSESGNYFEVDKFYQHESEIPDQYKDRIFKIKMHDIIHNRDIVLDTISKITNKTITPKIIESYNLYLNKQYELVKAKAPWMIT